MVNEISFFDVFKMLLVLGVILFLTYYVTKLLASKASGKSVKSFFAMGAGDCANVKAPTIIHRVMADRESKFFIVEYDGCDYFIAMTAGAIQVVEKRELTNEEIGQRKKSRDIKDQNGFNFSKYMEKYKNSQSNEGDKDSEEKN